MLPRHATPELAAAQSRLLSYGGDLSEPEREELRHMLCPWSTHGAGEEPPPFALEGEDKLP